MSDPTGVRLVRKDAPGTRLGPFGPRFAFWMAGMLPFFGALALLRAWGVRGGWNLPSPVDALTAAGAVALLALPFFLRVRRLAWAVRGTWRGLWPRVLLWMTGFALAVHLVLDGLDRLPLAYRNLTVGLVLGSTFLVACWARRSRQA